MTEFKEHIETNKKAWNQRTPIHIKSNFYNNDKFMKGENSLKLIELNAIGDVTEKSLLHLQCHFGQDSISLSRLGAKVTGVDLSDKAINKAKQIASDLKTNTNFICCDIYDLPNQLDEQFDIIFTSYGVIGWLPDLNKWAKIISRFLKPNGQFVFVEFHPFVWMFDDNFKKIKYNYFNSGAIVESEEGTYADKSAEINQEYVMWNHSLSEVINSLIQNELEINSLDEFDYSPYNIFDNSLKIEEKKYRIEHLENKIPMVYSIIATKTANTG